MESKLNASLIWSTLREKFSHDQSGPTSDIRELYQESSKWRAKFCSSHEILARPGILTVFSPATLSLIARHLCSCY